MDIEFKPTDKILILDFDHTCYDTDAFLLFEIRRPMLKTFDIPVKKWEESYEAAADIGYSLEQHLQELNKVLISPPCSLEEIQTFGKNIQFSQYLYSDTLSFLEKAKKDGYKIILLSFGFPEWQDKKVKGVGLEKLVNKVIYVNEHGGKVGILKKYFHSNPKVIFVDNNCNELDRVHKEMPNVETYFMRRTSEYDMSAQDNEDIRVRYLESRKMAEMTMLFEHKQCSSFKEVIL